MMSTGWPDPHLQELLKVNLPGPVGINLCNHLVHVVLLQLHAQQLHQLLHLVSAQRAATVLVLLVKDLGRVGGTREQVGGTREQAGGTREQAGEVLLSSVGPGGLLSCKPVAPHSGG